ncbi:hypothetical protein Lalb_Chr01g0017161 [Lupinus albus]|uniref:Uncharacterized protein n=1 Tax=Lupinus albus TaxID=3870 RepID=A0A6A4R8X6_LUPAL|nr:hypothetical protein Lalb_Chr01g0017161 [Lupinus albus]
MDKSIMMLAFLVVLLAGNVVHGQISSGEIIPCKVTSECVDCSCPLRCRDKTIECRGGQCRCGCGYCLKN